MDQSLKVTVAIPVFNAEKYLAQSIQSVLNQTYCNFELIITEDGSTDRSLEIARSFKDERISIISDGLNRGISYRLNQQIDFATGKYFARMDADDIAFPERLEEQLRLFENDPQLDIVDSEAIIIDENNEITGSRSMETDFTDIRKVFESAQFIHPTIMFRKDFIEKFLYNSEFNGAEDRDLWIRCFKSAKYGKISLPLYFYRESERLNLTSYLFRCSQIVKLYKKHKNIITFSLYCTLRLKMWFRKIISILACALKMDGLMMKRRNNIIPDNAKKSFSEKLAAAIKNG